VGIAGEHFVAQGKAVEGHHQRDAHLLAIGAMIAGIAALRLRICLGLTFKVGARNVIEQHLVLDCKQLAAALRQMRFELRLVCEQMIEATIKPILVDLLVSELQQIGKCRAPIPILGNVQLAGWLAEPRRHQHGRHLRPRDALLSDWQQPLAQILKPRSSPQRKRKV